MPQILTIRCLHEKNALENLNFILLLKKNFKKKLYGPFLWMRFNCLKATKPFQGDSLLLTTQSPRVPGPHLINLRQMNCWIDLGATQWFWTWFKSYCTLNFAKISQNCLLSAAGKIWVTLSNHLPREKAVTLKFGFPVVFHPIKQFLPSDLVENL